MRYCGSQGYFFYSPMAWLRLGCDILTAADSKELLAYVAQGCQVPSQSFFGALQCAAQAAEQHIFIFCAFC